MTGQMATDPDSASELDHDPTESALSRHRQRRAWRPLLLAGLLVAAIATAVFFAVKYYDLRDDARTQSAAQSQALETAKTSAAVLVTYDSGHYDDLDHRIKAISTPNFADSFVHSSEQARQGNSAVNGSSKAVAKEAGLESFTPERAVVLATLDQTVTSPELNGVQPQGVPYQSRVRITLIKRDGRWLVDDFAAI